MWDIDSQETCEKSYKRAEMVWLKRYISYLDQMTEYKRALKESAKLFFIFCIILFKQVKAESSIKTVLNAFNYVYHE
jgi:hypothetical protein